MADRETGASNSKSSGYKVLVVEDEAEIGRQISIRFELEGFEVLRASNGRDALRICESMHPDVVITDIRMPVGSGEKLLTDLHKGETISDNIPIVLCMSGYSDLALEQAVQKGASAFFAKPVDPGDLVAMSRSFLRKRELYLALESEAIALRKDVAEGERSLEQMGLQFAHELKNFVTGIVSSLELVLMPSNALRSLSDLKIRPLLRTAHRNSWELDEIIRTVHSLFSKDGTAHSEISAKDLVAVSMTFSNEYLIAHSVQVRVSPILEDFRIVCSFGAGRQILFNLLKNAAEAMAGQKSKEIRLAVRGDGQFCYFEIQDNGPGIPSEMEESVLQSRFSSKSEHLGLGLNFCMRAAEAFGGFIRIDKSDIGAKICFAVPLSCQEL